MSWLDGLVGQIYDTSTEKPVLGGLNFIGFTIVKNDALNAWDIQVGSGGSDPDAIHDNVNNEITAITEKTSLVAADVFVIEDSANSFFKRKITAANITATPSGAAGGGLAGTYPNPTVNGMTAGVLTNDTAHGSRGNGTLHTNVVAGGNSGFMSGADKTKLDSIASGATPNQTLAEVLVTGNSAGATDLNMNGQSILSALNITMSGSSPNFDYIDTAAAPNTQIYRFEGQGGPLYLRIRNDADTDGADVWRVQRTTIVVDSFDLFTTLDMVGNPINNGTYFQDDSDFPAGSGVFRTGNNLVMLVGRNSANTADIIAVRMDSNTVHLGDGTNGSVTNIHAAGNIGLRPTGSGSDEYAFTDAQANWNDNNLVSLGSSVQFGQGATPVFDQIDAAASTAGATMTIRAQDAITSAFDGGDLILSSGFGFGGEPGDPGDVVIQRGGTAAITILGTGNLVTIAPSTTFSASVNMNGQLDMNSQRITGALGVVIDGYTVATLPSNVNRQIIYVSDGDAGSPCLAVYDGTTYKRVVFGATVAAT